MVTVTLLVYGAAMTLLVVLQAVRASKMRKIIIRLANNELKSVMRELGRFAESLSTDPSGVSRKTEAVKPIDRSKN